MNVSKAINSYLTFRIGDELFAANVNKVNEIVEIPKITKVPGSPEFMPGVINLRGSVLPVIETRLKFGLQHQEYTVSSCIIVMSISNKDQMIVLGAIVDSVLEVIEIEDQQILPMPSIGARFNTEFIEGMVKREDQFVMLLDWNKIFSVSEVNSLREMVDAEVVHT